MWQPLQHWYGDFFNGSEGRRNVNGASRIVGGSFSVRQRFPQCESFPGSRTERCHNVLSRFLIEKPPVSMKKEVDPLGSRLWGWKRAGPLSSGRFSGERRRGKRRRSGAPWAGGTPAVPGRVSSEGGHCWGPGLPLTGRGLVGRLSRSGSGSLLAATSFA